MSPRPEILIYTKTGCPWCVTALAWLRDHGYTFREIVVTGAPDKFNEMRQVSGQTYAPTLVHGNLVLPDFGTEELEAFLARHAIRP